MTSSRRFLLGIFSVLLIGLLVLGFLHIRSAKAAGATVGVWLTTTDGANKLSQQGNQTFAADGTVPGEPTTIDVNDQQQSQQMVGFGAAVTDSSAWLIANKLSTAQRNAVMTNLFSPTSGIGIDYVRIPMGASDFSVTGSYSYDDLPAGQTDPSLTHFSISHDTAYIVPVLQQALALNPSLKFMANPWSPPAWMKTNGSMIGSVNGNTGTLIASDYAPLAQYFVKFIQAYQAQGIPIYAITPQNEPLYAPNNYPGMYWAASDENNFIKNYLSPALASAGLSTKILGYDHNWDNTAYAQTLLGDATTYNDIAGIAWHCYGGSPSAMTTIHNQYPGKDAYETECATGAGVTPINTIDLLMQSVQNWAKTVELWNIALDTNDGPHTGGCPDCLGVVTIDQATGNVTYPNDYYLVGHFSKFAQPGAYHIGGDVSGSFESTSFMNPDGSKVTVVHNSNSSSAAFKVRWDGSQSFDDTLPAGATVTFKWSGSAGAVTGLNINAGGGAIGTWIADTDASGGTVPAASTNTIDTSGVSIPAPQGVYQTNRYGNSTYTIPGLVANAKYTVTLQFAETYWTAAGKRVFNVAINGATALANFDIYASAGGANKAVAKSFTATANGSGAITIQFTTVTDNAQINGIQVAQQASGISSLSINAGGGATGSWVADVDGSGGTVPAASTNTIDTSGVSNPAPQAVYQTNRYGNFTYTIPGLTANANYTVSLQFAETYWTAVGKRVFNISINGSQVLTDFDIYASAGANKAIAENFTAAANSSGVITIQFTTVTDNAQVNGIQLTQQ